MTSDRSLIHGRSRALLAVGLDAEPWASLPCHHRAAVQTEEGRRGMASARLAVPASPSGREG